MVSAFAGCSVGRLWVLDEAYVMLTRFRAVVALLALSAVVVVGCSGSVKPDPWAEYAAALVVEKREAELHEQVFALHLNDPTPENKTRLDSMNARLDKASKHAKAIRERLPD
jgi:hypothetical protein